MAEENAQSETGTEISVSAETLVGRLRQQRSQLQNELDILSIAYDDIKHQLAHAMERIAELEDRDSEAKPKEKTKT